MIVLFSFLAFITSLAAINFLDSNSTGDDRSNLKGFDLKCQWKKIKPFLKVYWLNLNASKDRSIFMADQLQNIGLENEKVVAIAPNMQEFNITLLKKPCKRNTPIDLAVILSHLTAMYKAVYDVTYSSHKYALIMEDDVRFHFDVDFEKLVASAPKEFGVLQLSVSNIEAIHKLWNSYTMSVPQKLDMWTSSNWRVTTKDKKTVLYWSTQAYLINKAVIKPFIDDVIDVWYQGEEKKLSFKIVNSFYESQCKRTKEFPCILANCLFADSYLYAGSAPHYVLNFPLFNGDLIGLKSLVHQDHVLKHKTAFIAMQHLINRLKSGSIKLADFLSVPECRENEAND